LQIRYADTDEQKKLKNPTTERRQFKTHEYNAVVFGGTSYQYPSPTSDGFPASFTSHVQGAWMTQPSVSPRYVVQSTIPSCTDFESQQYCKPKSVNGQRHADESCCTRIHGTCPRPVQSTRLVYCRQPKCDRCEQAHSQEKSTPGSVASTPEKNSTTGDVAPPNALHDDVSSSSILCLGG
jgi:hypothetical protein